jgi:hypothetical protein
LRSKSDNSEFGLNELFLAQNGIAIRHFALVTSQNDRQEIFDAAPTLVSDTSSSAELPMPKILPRRLIVLTLELHLDG